MGEPGGGGDGGGEWRGVVIEWLNKACQTADSGYQNKAQHYISRFDYIYFRHIQGTLLKNAYLSKVLEKSGSRVKVVIYDLEIVCWYNLDLKQDCWWIASKFVENEMEKSNKSGYV